jgi:hypothetical protein
MQDGAKEGVAPLFSAGTWTQGEVWQILRNCIPLASMSQSDIEHATCIGDHQIPASNPSTSTSYVTLAVISPIRSLLPSRNPRRRSNFIQLSF